MNAAAITGVVDGTSQATSNATFRRPMAVADVVRLRRSHGIRYGTSIDTVWNTHATVTNGAAATPASVVNSRMNRMWRMSSFVGDPRWVTAPGLRRETQRTMIAVTAARLAAAEMPPPGHPDDQHESGMGDGIADVVQARTEVTRDPELDGEYAVEVIHDVVVEHQRNQILSAAVEHEQANREHAENRDKVGGMSARNARDGACDPPWLRRGLTHSVRAPYERAWAMSGPSTKK